MFAPTDTVIPDNDADPMAVAAQNPEMDLEILKSVPQRFSVQDESSANWLLRRVLASRDYGEKVKAFAQQELRRAEREERTLLFLFGRQLQAWTKGELQKLNGRRKSLALPAGILSFKTVPASLQIDDEQAVLAWAKKHLPAAVLTVEKLSRSILSDHFKHSGEVPDCGAHVEPERQSFSIK